MATSDFPSDEMFNFKCSSCVNLKRNREAVRYCVECQGYCCQECVDIHTAFAALKSHTLLDKFSFKSTRSGTDLPEVPTERCREHEIKLMDMYCKNHDVVGCTTCMALEHRSCNDVQSIPHSIETIFQVSDAHKTHQTLQEKTSALQKVKVSREANLQELDKSKEKALNAIKDFRKELRDILDKLEKACLNQVEVEFRNQESILKEQEKKIECAIGVMKKAADDLQKSGGNKSQQFVLMKISKKNIEQFESISKPPDEQITTITFSKNQGIHDFLEHLETFGKVTVNPRDSLNQRTTVYSINDKREMNIRLQSDPSDCRVEGACLTNDWMLLLADNSNRKLKRAHIVEMTIVDHSDMPAGPNDVCCISKQEAAVALSDNTIQFISLANPMALVRKLKLDHRCFGIAHKNERLYITEAGSSLYVHDMSGNLLQTVSQDKLGKTPFMQNQHISFSDNGRNIFVADWQNGVILLDTNTKGQHINTFDGDSGLTNVHDICSDSRGNLFVSGYGSHNVVQFSQDEKKKIGVVVKQSDSLYKPYCVCFDPCRNILIVTLFPSDTVKLFELR